MQEQWKPIKDFENYEVSNMGNVRSLNYRYTRAAKKLRLRKQRDGYLYVKLYKNGKQYNKNVHRLVTTTFIPNPQGKKEVNHIDGDKTNNRVSNLEWVTAKENQQHAWESGLHVITEETKKKMSEAHKKQVICVTTGEKFDCIRDAQEKYNVANSNISACCKGKLKSAGKLPTGERLIWKYVEEI